MRLSVIAMIFCLSLSLASLAGCGGDQNAGTDGEIPGPSENASIDDPGPVPDGQSEPQNTESNSTTGKATGNESKPETEIQNISTAINLEPGDWEAVQKLVAEHKGKVVVVDLWALTCIPCRREFPHLVELSKSHADKVACISVCCDYLGDEDNPPESIKPQALKFLAKQGAEFQNVLMTTPQPDFFEAISLGSLPAIYVYDMTGKQATRLDNDVPEFAENGFTYKDHVIPLIEKLLGEE